MIFSDHSKSSPISFEIVWVERVWKYKITYILEYWSNWLEILTICQFWPSEYLKKKIRKKVLIFLKMSKNKLIIRPLIFQKVSTIITPNFYQIIVMVIHSNILKFQIHWLSSSQNTHFSYVTYDAVSIVCLGWVHIPFLLYKQLFFQNPVRKVAYFLGKNRTESCLEVA